MTDTLTTWADKFGERSLHMHALQSPSFVGDRTPPAEGVSIEDVATAFVNAGRWLAACPADGCHGCEYVHTGHLLFFCCECRNATWGNHPLRVELPDDRKRAAIEAALTLRPVPQTRNWHPSETVTQLHDENRENGVTA